MGNSKILTGLISDGKSSPSPQHLNEVCFLECGCNLDHRLLVLAKILELKAFADVVRLGVNESGVFRLKHGRPQQKSCKQCIPQNMLYKCRTQAEWVGGRGRNTRLIMTFTLPLAPLTPRSLLC